MTRGARRAIARRASRSRAGAAFGAFLALGFALSTAPLLADYRQAYLDGVQALRGGAPEKAADRFAAAIAERPDEQARARLVGVIPEPYLPHHYLGLALFALHRCPEALAEWTISAQQGATAGLAASLAERREPEANCRALGEAEAALTGARQALARAGPRATPAEIEVARESIETTARDLTAARTAWDFAAVGTAARRAQAAREAAEDLAREVERRAAVPTPGPSATPPGGSAASPAPLASPPSTEPPPAAAPAQTGRDLPTGPGGGAPAPSQAPATGGASTASPAPALVVAAQAFFDGEYELALRLLGRPELAEDRAAPFVVHLFAGAARPARFLLGGATDRTLLAAAEDDVRAARRSRPRFTPAPRDFSPRFVAFYGATR